MFNGHTRYSTVKLIMTRDGLLTEIKILLWHLDRFRYYITVLNLIIFQRTVDHTVKIWVSKSAR